MKTLKNHCHNAPASSFLLFLHPTQHNTTHMSITSDEVNFLVHRYLQESGTAAVGASCILP
jgi:hypothetical protein